MGFSDFWRRWHISLSGWLRDYLYIPLGGNRKGPLRTYANLMITMLLGGLWHGASWTFVAWGALHGALLGIERWLRGWLGPRQQHHPSAVPRSKIPNALAMLGTFLVVTITWVFFRAGSFTEAWHMLSCMAGATTGRRVSLYASDIIAVWVIIGLTLAVQWRLRSTSLEAVVSAAPAGSIVVAWSCMFFALIAERGAGGAFIYFRF
jgi:alginate O-acetyltransferase complex protein AlgI